MVNNLALFVDGAVMAPDVYNVDADRYSAPGTFEWTWAGVPDDIGPMIAALLSDDNRWVNAYRIEVSGGIGLSN